MVVVIYSRSEKFHVQSSVKPRPDFFKVTTNTFELLKNESECYRYRSVVLLILYDE